MLQKQSFEQIWRERFARFANQADDDAGIAGWSPTGLATRIRHFNSLWSRQDNEKRWLDAGCGAGTYSGLLDSSGAEVIALDFSPVALQKGKQRYPQTIQWGVADVTRLPLPTHSVDGALCFGVTQAMSASEPVFEELIRVIKPGGQLWIDGLNSWCLPHIVVQLRRKLLGLEPHLRYQSPWQFRTIAKQQGLQHIKLHWLAIAPSRLASFQSVFDSRLVQQLFQYVPVIAAFFSHSMIIQARTATK